jgi:hypothetical protein
MKTTEEIKKLSDKELEEIIHVEVVGGKAIKWLDECKLPRHTKCPAPNQTFAPLGKRHHYEISDPCPECKWVKSTPIYPAYCSDNSPRKLLNDVITKLESNLKGKELSCQAYSAYMRLFKILLHRPARQICEAIVEVVKGEH